MESPTGMIGTSQKREPSTPSKATGGGNKDGNKEAPGRDRKERVKDRRKEERQEKDPRAKGRARDSAVAGIAVAHIMRPIAPPKGQRPTQRCI